MELLPDFSYISPDIPIDEGEQLFKIVVVSEDLSLSNLKTSHVSWYICTYRKLVFSENCTPDNNGQLPVFR